jgi:hypothetical protein
VPPQSWELDLDIKKNLKAWGSANLKFYGRWIEDYIEFIPVGTGWNARQHRPRDELRRVADSTINLDPLGWKGAKIDANATYENSNLQDPLTFETRSFSGHNYFNGEISLRYDVPQSNWAFGGGFNWTQVEPYVRLSEVGKDYEGPIYTFAFIENKDVFGLTVSLNMFNLTGGRACSTARCGTAIAIAARSRSSRAAGSTSRRSTGSRSRAASSGLHRGRARWQAARHEEPSALAALLRLAACTPRLAQGRRERRGAHYLGGSPRSTTPGRSSTR